MTEPNDDLGRRLHRLASPVDVEAALAGVHVAGRRRQTRQRQVVAATMAVVMLVLISGVAVARQDRDLTDVATSEPDTPTAEDQDEPLLVDERRTGTTAGPGTTAPAEVVAPLETAAATTSTRPPPRSTSPSTATPDGARPGDGPIDGSSWPVPMPVPGDDPAPDDQVPAPGPAPIEFSIRPEQPAVRSGERLTFWVDITNRGSVPIKVNAGECGSVEVVGIFGSTTWVGAPPWSGAAGTLAAYADGPDVQVRAYPTEPSWGGLQHLCSPTDYQPTLGYTTTLQPGAATSHVYVWDAAFLPPFGGAVTSVDIRARVRFPDSDREPEYGTASVPVIDDPGAHVSPFEFLTAADSHPALRGWVAENPASGAGYRLTVAFARGAFELWIDAGTQRLRVRGSTTTSAILEIRSLPSGSLPGDDPNAWGPPPGEVILFPT